MKKRTTSSRYLLREKKQKGMSLIEVLVSMLVVGLALVTSISMIQTANRFGNSAEYSSSALYQAQTIIDKIRANKIGVGSYIFTSNATNGDVDSAIGSGVYDKLFNLVDMRDIPAKLLATCGTNLCTTESVQTAKTDMTQWVENLSSMLPEGKGVVRALDANRASYEVVVMWRNVAESSANVSANANAQGIFLRFSL